jgi:hypothetical protein
VIAVDAINSELESARVAEVAEALAEAQAA